MNKKTVICFITVLLAALCIFISGCSRAPVIKTNEVNSSNALSNADKGSEIAASFEGIYKYDYEGDTEALPEDHYIVLEMCNGSLRGRYYGTSDDFDGAREGYYPGFYVSDMQNLRIGDNEISFDIELQEEDMFSMPVDTKYSAGTEVPLGENTRWENSHIIEVSEKNPRGYKGEIAEGKITLHMENSQRIFIMQNDM